MKNKKYKYIMKIVIIMIYNTYSILYLYSALPHREIVIITTLLFYSAGIGLCC